MPVVRKYETSIDDFNDSKYKNNGYTTMEIKTPAENIASDMPVVRKYETSIDDFNFTKNKKNGYTTMEIKTSAENIAADLPFEDKCTDKFTVRGDSTDTQESKEAKSVENKVEDNCTEESTAIKRYCNVSTDTQNRKEAKSVENKDKLKYKTKFKFFKKLRKSRKISEVNKRETTELNRDFIVNSCLKTIIKTGLKWNRKAKNCIRLLPYVLALIIFPTDTGAHITKSVVLTLASNPVVIDGDMRLICTLPRSLLKKTVFSMSWQRRHAEEFEVIGIGEHPSDKSKYSLQILHRNHWLDYIVDVHNVNTVDVLSIYRCDIAFYSQEENASSLAQDLVYSPKKDEVVLSSVCENRILRFTLMIKKILPRPEKITADFQGKHLTGNVDLTLQTNTGLFNATVIFETTTDDTDISAYIIFTYKNGNFSIPILTTCKQMSATKGYMALIPVLLTALAIFGVVVYYVKVRKKKIKRPVNSEDQEKLSLSKTPSKEENMALAEDILEGQDKDIGTFLNTDSKVKQ